MVYQSIGPSAQWLPHTSESLGLVITSVTFFQNQLSQHPVSRITYQWDPHGSSQRHCIICPWSVCFTGDGKSAPNPLFRVKVVLEGDKVEFSPTLKQLAFIVGNIGSHLTDSISGIRRLPDILTRKRSNKEPINVVIGKSQTDECYPSGKIQLHIVKRWVGDSSNLVSRLPLWSDSHDLNWESHDFEIGFLATTMSLCKGGLMEGWHKPLESLMLRCLCILGDLLILTSSEYSNC